MARKRKGHHRRRSTARRVTRRRGRSRSAGGTQLRPSREDLHLAVAGFAVGALEAKMKTDSSFFLNKLPAPITQIGRTGNLALTLWLLSHVMKNRWLRVGARAAATITTYQMGRLGGAHKSTDVFTIQGWSDEDVARAIQMNMGALDPAGGDGMPGAMAFDPSVAEYGG